MGSLKWLFLRALALLALATLVTACAQPCESSAGRYVAIGESTTQVTQVLDTCTGAIFIALIRIPDPTIVRIDTVRTAVGPEQVKLPPPAPAAAQSAPPAEEPPVPQPMPTAATGGQRKR